MIVEVWTLTVDHPDDGFTTSVHASEAETLAELQGLHVQLLPEAPVSDEDVVQELCDMGYVIYIEEHSVDAEAKQHPLGGGKQ